MLKSLAQIRNLTWRMKGLKKNGGGMKELKRNHINERFLILPLKIERSRSILVILGNARFRIHSKYVIPEVLYRESIERNGSPIRDLGDDVNYFFLQIEVAWVYSLIPVPLKLQYPPGFLAKYCW